MAKNSDDRRARRSRRLLKESLLVLMKRKEFSQISVRDVTDEADMNRGTFYLHYSGTAELLQSVEEELLEELRMQGYTDIRTIKFALLETNGQLSILPRAEEKPATAAQLGIATQETGLPVVLVSDGRLLEHNLKGRGYEQVWLEKQLAAHGLHSHRQAFLLTVDEGGNTCCVPKKEAKS